MDKYFQLEGMDRAHMILCMMQEAFGSAFYTYKQHPSIHNDECQRLLEAATDALADLYQEIGQWEVEE